MTSNKPQKGDKMNDSKLAVVAKEIFEKVIPVVEYFRKNGELDESEIIHILEIPLFRELVIHIMALNIRDKKYSLDDWEKTEIGKKLYNDIVKYVMGDRYVNGNDNDNKWSCDESCKELKILNTLLKESLIFFRPPTVPQVKRAVANLRRCMFNETDVLKMSILDDVDKQNVDRNLDGNVSE